jgi:hypothetical protein
MIWLGGTRRGGVDEDCFTVIGNRVGIKTNFMHVHVSIKRADYSPFSKMHRVSSSCTSIVPPSLHRPCAARGSGSTQPTVACAIKGYGTSRGRSRCAGKARYARMYSTHFILFCNRLHSNIYNERVVFLPGIFSAHFYLAYSRNIQRHILVKCPSLTKKGT